MRKHIGIQLNGNYDLDVSGGALAVGDVTAQNQAMLLLAHKGEYKENPLTGVGIEDMVNDHEFAAWRREITEQLERDGQRITGLRVNERELAIEAAYS